MGTMRRWTISLVLLLAACGQNAANPTRSQTGRPTAVQSESATPATTPHLGLIVVLEARRAGSTFGGGPDAYDAHDVVAIAGTDGYARAKQTFKARSLPFIGNAGVLLQPEARVAAGAVFFVDGTGVVRRLSATGSVTEVTTIPFGQPQQEMSFAVSRDGKRVIASVLTLPAKNPNAQMGGDPPYVAGSHAFLELFTADAGGPARSLVRTDLGTLANNSQILRVVGWDASGPVVTLQQSLGTQQGSLGTWFEGMELAHLDASGHPGPALTPTDCMPWQELDDASVLCSGGDFRNVTLIDAAGKASASFPGVSGPFLAISPDKAWVTYLGGAQNRSGRRVSLPDRFFPLGWLDASTIVGYLEGTGSGATVGNMALVRLADPSHIDDLGFTGVLAGVL
jgi:hypothetical protein